VIEEVEVSDLDFFQAGRLGCAKTALGLDLRGGGKVVHVELGSVGQEVVRDVRIKRGDKSSYVFDLIFIYVAGNKEGRGNEKRRIRALGDVGSEALEVIEGPAVGNTTEGAVEVFIPGFEIKFDGAA